jgi:hypothetical protein
MRKYAILPALAAGVLCGLALAQLLPPREAALANNAPAQGKAQQWEYKLVIPFELVPTVFPDPGKDEGREAGRKALAQGEKNYNQLGGDGWEAAGYHPGNPPHYILFKRPRR